MIDEVLITGVVVLLGLLGLGIAVIVLLALFVGPRR